MLKTITIKISTERPPSAKHWKAGVYHVVKAAQAPPSCFYTPLEEEGINKSKNSFATSCSGNPKEEIIGVRQERGGSLWEVTFALTPGVRQHGQSGSQDLGRG